jgi:hypothetical protein
LPSQVPTNDEIAPLARAPNRNAIWSVLHSMDYSVLVI